MSNKASWPKWLKIVYHYGKKNMKYTGSVINPYHFVEVIERYSITHYSIIEIKINDILLKEDEITHLFNWLNKVKKEMEKNEEREATNSETKGSDVKSWTGSEGMVSSEELFS